MFDTNKDQVKKVQELPESGWFHNNLAVLDEEANVVYAVDYEGKCMKYDIGKGKWESVTLKKIKK